MNQMGLHSVKRILILLFILVSIQPVFAAGAGNFTVFGDLPSGGSGANFSIAAYNNSQPSANPCDGTGDTTGDITYYQRSAQSGNTNFNDNIDYNVSSNINISGTTPTVYFYFCNQTTLVAWISKVVQPTIDLELDLGRVAGGAAVHDNLAGNTTYVCSGNLSGGTQLNTVNRTLDAGNANYEQYYVIDNRNASLTSDDTNDIYVYIDHNAAGACSFDNTTVAALYINRSRGDYEYGVNATWEPDTRVTGDLHAELINSTIYVYNTSDVVIGIANQSAKAVLNGTAQAPDGLNNSDNDYVLYYDNSAGTIKMVVAPVNNTLGFTNTTVYGLPNGFTNTDLVIKVYGDTPVTSGSIIHMVNATLNDSVSYTTITDKSNGLYKFYMRDFRGNTTVNFTFAEVANGTIQLNVSRSNFGNVTVGPAGVNDTSINASVFVGDLNNLLRIGNSNVSVYTNATCTGSLMSTATVTPRTDGYNTNQDYEVYYEFNATTTTYYLLLTFNNVTYNYTSCGVSASSVGAGDQNTANVLFFANGTAQSDIVTVALDTDQNGADDILTTTLNSGAYFIFTTSDATTDVRFDSAGGAIQLIRTKDLSTNQTIDVAKLYGEAHIDLATGTADDNISIHTDANCTSAKVSSEIEQPAVAGGDDYAQFYEPTGGITAYFINASDRGGTLFSCVRFRGGRAADANSTNLTVKLTGEVPTGVALIGVNNDNTAGDDVITNQTRGTTPNINYTIFMPPGDGTDVVNIYNTTGQLVYTNSTVGLSNVTGAQNNATLDLARVIGDAHANLQEGSDRVRACSNLICSSVFSSQTVNPAAGAGADDDFALYYEVNATTGRVIILEVLDESGLIDYTAYVNLTGINEAAILPGDSDTQDLTQLLNGTTPNTLDFVWVDIGTSDEGVWNLSANINNGTTNVTYRLYHGYTSTTNYNIKFDENNDESTVSGTGPAVNLILLKDIFTHTTLNVSIVEGNVPADFNSDIFELETTTGLTCLGSSYGSNDTMASDVLPATPDYRMYFETNGSALTINFCDNTTSTVKQLERSFNRTNNNGGGAINVTLNVAKLAGSIHRDFLNSTFGTDNVSIYNNSVCGTGILSSEPESPSAAASAAGGSYETFFEPGASGAYYINATASHNMTNVQRNYTSCIRFTFNGTSGATSFVNITVLMEGNVSTDAASVAADVNATSDGVADAWTNNLAVNGTGDYKLYTFPGDGTDVATIHTAADAGGVTYLNRTVALNANLSFNVSRINGSLHVDLINTNANDSLHIYSNTACTTRLSSEDLIINSSDRYVQYFQTTPGSAFYIGLVNDNATANYSSCINPTQNMTVAGSSNNYNLTVKVSGNLATGLDNIYLDPNGNSLTWAINSSVVTPTTPDTFITFFSGAASTNVNATGTTDYTELVRTAKDFSASGLVSRNFTFNVSRVDGEAHADLEVGGDDRVEVASNNACTTLVSSQNETPTDAGGTDYQQYFEDTANVTYYVNITLNEVSANYSTCMRAGFEVASNNENLTVDFSRKVSGTVPDISANVVATDTLSVGADIDAAQSGVDVLALTTDNGTSTVYRLFMNGTLAGASDTVIFFGALNGTIDKLNITRSLAADTTFNVSAVGGDTHADLRGASDFVNVCSGVPRMTAFSLCPDVTYNSHTENPSANKYTNANDYEVIFEQSSNSTYYVQVNDSDDRNYFTYLNFTSSAGSVSNISLNGKLFGNVNETFNTSAINETNITLWDNTDTGIWAWSRSLDNGSYRMYHNSTIGGAFDAQFKKNGYVTQDWGNSSLNAIVLGTVSLNVSLDSGVRIIILEYNTNNTIPNATVTLYNCTSSAGSSCNSTVILNACSVPVGNCQVAGDNTSGRGLDGVYRFMGIPNATFFQVKIERTNFTTILDPDPANPNAPAYQIDGVTIQPTGLTTALTYYVQLADADTPSLLAPDDGAFPRNSTPTLNWSSVSRAGNYELWIANNSAFTVINNALNTTALSFTPAALPAGKYYWRVRVWDSAGNPGSWSAVRTFTIDTTAPTVSISTPTAGANLSGVIVINGTATDVTAGIDYVTLYSAGCGTSPISNTTSSPFSFSWKTAAADDGNKTLCAVAVDKAGNTANSTTVAATVDNTPPSSVVITQVSGNRTSGNYVFIKGTTVVSVTASDAASIQKVDFYIDGGFNLSDASSPFDFTWDTAKIGDGSHVLSAKAYDNANNSRESATFNVIVDNGAPISIVIASPQNNTYVTATVTITVAVSDSQSIQKVDFFNGTTLIVADTSSPFTANWVTAGDSNQTLLATAYDDANNTVNSSVVIVITDNTAPSNVAVVHDSGIYDADGVVTWNWTAPSDGTGSGIDYYMLRLNDSSGTFYTTNTTATSLTYSGLSNGQNYTLSVRAVDKVSIHSAAWTTSNGIVIDLVTVPSLLAPDDASYTSDTTPTFNWSNATSGGTYEIWIANNSAFTVLANASNVTNALSFTPGALPAGKYYWRVRVWDSAGNPGSWSAVRTLTVDATAPTASISVPSGGANLSGTIVINATASDATAGIAAVEFYAGGCGSNFIGNATAEPFQFSWVTTSAGDGNKTLCVTAIDKAGNSVNSGTVAITVDNTPPSSVVITQVSGNRTAGNFVYVAGTTIVSVTANDAASIQKVEFYIDGGLNLTDASSPFDFTWDTAKIGDGSHVLKAKAYDNANNSRESATFNVIVDNGAPESVVIVSPTNDTYVTGTVTVVAAVADSESIQKVDFFNGTTLIGADTTSPYAVNWATSGDGVQRLTATAYDNANNTVNSSVVTVTVDNTAPLIPTVVLPTSATYKKGGDALTVRYRYNETNPDKIIIRIWDNTTTYGTVTFESGLTGGNNQERNDSVIIGTTAPEGTYTINITVIDKVNQTQTAQTNGLVVVDNTVPSANITSPTASQSLNGTWTVTTTVADGGAVAAGIEKVEFYVSGALNQTDTSSPYTFSWNTAQIPDGVYVIKIKAYDRANNTNESTGVAVTVDNGRPQDVTIISPIHNSNVTGQIRILVSVADNINISQVNVYNGTTLIASDTAAPWEIYWTTSNAADGIHTLLATAYDNNNNALNSSQVNITVDNTVPSNVAVVHDPGIYDTDGVVTWNWTAPSDGAGSGVDYYTLRLNDSSGTFHTANTTATSLTYSGLTNGQNYTLSVRVVDKVGLQSSAWTTSNGIFVDTMLPAITVNTAAYGPFASNPTDPIDVDFSDNNNLDYVSYKVNSNGSYTNISITINGTTYTTNWDVWGNANIQEGVNTVFLLAVDDAGNSRVATETVTYTVDTTRPRAAINFPVAGTESGTSTSFMLATTEQSVCQFKLDSASFAAMSSTNSTIHEQNLTVTGGSHTVRANCTDIAQNFNDSKSVTWTVNTDGPTLSSLIYSDLDAIVNASFTVNTTAVGGLYIISGIQYVINNISSSATNISAPQDGAFDETTEDINFTLSVSGLNGTYTLYARANNSQGTQGGWYARTFIADTVLPNISISSPANGTITNVTPTITITVQDNEGGTGINISTLTVADSINGSLTVNGCSTPDSRRTYTCSFAPAGLADNRSHQINVTIDDVAGNRQRFDRNFTVDTTKTITASLISSDTVGVADNDYANGWSFVFNISTGSGGNSLRFKMDNWTIAGGSAIISVFNNTYMEYTNSTGSLRNYTVKNSYDENQVINPLNDTDTSTSGTQSQITIRIKIPTGTTAGAYSTSYGAGLYSST